MELGEAFEIIDNYMLFSSDDVVELMRGMRAYQKKGGNFNFFGNSYEVCLFVFSLSPHASIMYLVTTC